MQLKSPAGHPQLSWFMALTLCLMARNAPQVPGQSAEGVVSKQSLITQRELGQDIKVIYSSGMNPLPFCTKEDQRQRGIKDFQVLCSTGCP